MTTLIQNLRTEDQTAMLALDTKITNLELARVDLELSLETLKAELVEAEEVYEALRNNAIRVVYLGEEASNYKNETVRKLAVQDILTNNDESMTEHNNIIGLKRKIVEAEADIKRNRKQSQALKRQFDLGIALLRARR